MSTISAGTTAGTALVSTGNTDGTLQLQVNGTTPAVTLNTSGAVGVGSTPGYGTSGQVLTSGGSAAAPSWATVSAGYTLGTPVATTSGTTVEFTGIPTTAKQVLINFNQVSTNTATTSNLQLQLGTSSAYITSSYASVAIRLNATSLSVITDTTLFNITKGVNADATDAYSGIIVLDLLDSTNNIWSLSGQIGSMSNTLMMMSTGKAQLTGNLYKFKIFDSSGATFDLGSMNIMYI